jgi:hypothetical protein
MIATQGGVKCAQPVDLFQKREVYEEARSTRAVAEKQLPSLEVSTMRIPLSLVVVKRDHGGPS